MSNKFLSLTLILIGLFFTVDVVKAGYNPGSNAALANTTVVRDSTGSIAVSGVNATSLNVSGTATFSSNINADVNLRSNTSSSLQALTGGTSEIGYATDIPALVRLDGTGATFFTGESFKNYVSGTQSPNEMAFVTTNGLGTLANGYFIGQIVDVIYTSPVSPQTPYLSRKIWNGTSWMSLQNIDLYSGASGTFSSINITVAPVISLMSGDINIGSYIGYSDLEIISVGNDNTFNAPANSGYSYTQQGVALGNSVTVNSSNGAVIGNGNVGEQFAADVALGSTFGDKLVSSTHTFGHIQGKTTGTTPTILTLDGSSVVNVINPTVNPTATVSSGGTLPIATYYLMYTYTNKYGATLPSTEWTVPVTVANQEITVPPPGASTGADSWCLYASTTTGTETDQGCIVGLTGGSHLYLRGPLTLTSSPPPTFNTASNELTLVSNQQNGGSFVSSLIFTFGIRDQTLNTVSRVTRQVDLINTAGVLTLANPTGNIVGTDYQGIAGLTLSTAGVPNSTAIVFSVNSTTQQLIVTVTPTAAFSHTLNWGVDIESSVLVGL